MTTKVQLPGTLRSTCMIAGRWRVRRSSGPGVSCGIPDWGICWARPSPSAAGRGWQVPHALVTPSLPVKTRRFKDLRGIRPRRLASEGAVLYPEWAMDSNSTRIGSVSGEGGPATRAEGDMRQDHAAYSRRDPPDAATKSRAAGRLRPIREPGPGVICGASAPDNTSDDLRPCPGPYAAPGGRISPASRKRKPTPSSLFPADCRTSAAFGPDDYAARRRCIISNYPAAHLVLVCSAARDAM